MCFGLSLIDIHIMMRIRLVLYLVVEKSVFQPVGSRFTSLSTYIVFENQLVSPTYTQTMGIKAKNINAYSVNK